MCVVLPTWYVWALCRLSKHLGRNLHYLNVELFSREIIKDQLCASDLTFQTIFLHLDLLVVARTAPHHSYSNRAECIMSLLNIGLQNVALQCQSMPDEYESRFKYLKTITLIRRTAKRSSYVEKAIFARVSTKKNRKVKPLRGESSRGEYFVGNTMQRQAG